MNLETGKILGGVGALLMGITPFLGSYTGVLGLIGLILVMIALKGLSDHYSEEGIFNNALYGVVIALIGGVISVAVIVMAAVDFLSAVGIEISTAWSDPAVFSSINWQEVVTWDVLWPHIAVIIGSLVLLFVFVVVASVFFKKIIDPPLRKDRHWSFWYYRIANADRPILTIVGIGFLLL